MGKGGQGGGRKNTSAALKAKGKSGESQQGGVEVRKISGSDIQLVQNLIERCLQLYMEKKEVVNTLQTQAGIEPGFTSLVWQKLEEQNPEFFNAYKVRLKLQDQIHIFNHLLEEQMQLTLNNNNINNGNNSNNGNNNSTNSNLKHQGPYQQDQYMQHNLHNPSQPGSSQWASSSKMTNFNKSSTVPGIPTGLPSYGNNNLTSNIGSPMTNVPEIDMKFGSRRGSYGQLTSLDAQLNPPGMPMQMPMNDGRYMGAGGDNSYMQPSSSNNPAAMSLAVNIGTPTGMMNDQNGVIGSFNDPNSQFPRAIPRNLSLGEIPFGINNQINDDDSNALNMLGNIPESKERMAFPTLFDQDREGANNDTNNVTYKLPRNFSLSDMVNFS